MLFLSKSWAWDVILFPFFFSLWNCHYSVNFENYSFINIFQGYSNREKKFSIFFLFLFVWQVSSGLRRWQLSVLSFFSFPLFSLFILYIDHTYWTKTTPHSLLCHFIDLFCRRFCFKKSFCLHFMQEKLANFIPSTCICISEHDHDIQCWECIRTIFIRSQLCIVHRCVSFCRNIFFVGIIQI